MIVKPNSVRPYAPFELRILSALRDTTGLETNELLKAAYPDPQARPPSAARALNFRMRRLQQKIEDNREHFRLANSNRTGGAVRLAWWLEDRV